MTEPRLPTKLWLDGHLHHLTVKGVPYYIIQRGDRVGGLVLLKLNGLEHGVKLLTQQRDLDGVMQWVGALDQDIVSEQDAEAYINRAVARDPDLWVVEIEDRDMSNPFV